MSSKVLAAASLYAALRMNSALITLKELAALADMSWRLNEIARTYRKLVFATGVKVHRSDPAELIQKIASVYGVSRSAIDSALGLVRNAESRGYDGGREPSSLAAAALYIVCLSNGKALTQAQVAEAAGVCKKTVRQNVKMINRANAPR